MTHEELSFSQNGELSEGRETATPMSRLRTDKRKEESLQKGFVESTIA